MRHAVRLLTPLAAALLGVGALASPALAAAPTRTTSTPGAGTVVRTAPGSVTATFNQTLGPTSSMRVDGPAGASSCTTAPPTSMTLTCSYAAGATLPDGLYTATYTTMPSATSTTDTASTGSFSYTLDSRAPAKPSVAVNPSPYLAGSTTLTVSGKAEASGDAVAVTLTSGSTSVSGSGTAGDGGAYAVQFSAAQVRSLTEGTVTVSVTDSDPAGNVSDPTTTTFTKDVNAPAVVSTTPDNGASLKPSAFTSYTVTSDETLGSSSRVDLVSSTGDTLATAQTVSGKTVSAKPTQSLGEGTYTARISLVDTAGNTSAAMRTFTLDGTAPATPVINAIGAANKATAAKLPVSGTGEAGAKLTLTVSDLTSSKAYGPVTVAANGTWAFDGGIDVSAFGDGNLNATASQSDAASNTSATSAGVTITKDTLSPVVSGQTATPARLSSASTTATVKGSVANGATPSGNEVGAKVAISADDTDDKTKPVTASATSGSDGSFSASFDVSALSDGTITYTIVATDTAGNPSAPVTATNTLDRQGPPAPSVDPIGVVNKAGQGAVTVKGSAPTDATSVSIVVTDSAGKTITGSTTVNASSRLFSTTLNLTSLADGKLSFVVTPIDAAGNRGTGTEVTTTKDAMAPAAPSVAVPTFNTTDGLLVSGSAEAGTSVKVTATDTTTPTAKTSTKTVTAAGDGTYSATLDVAGFNQGNVSVSAVATDVAGNPSTAGTASTTRDTVAPGAPSTVSADPSPYTPTSTTLTVSGRTATADASASGLVADITVTDAGGIALSKTGVAVSTGSFSYAFSQEQVRTLADGTLTVSVTLRDPAGNRGEATTTTLTKDATVLALVSTSPANGSFVNAPKKASATFSENLAQSSTISVANKAGQTLGGTTTISGATITFTPASDFTEAGSAYTVTVKAVSANTSTETLTSTFSFTVDNTAPAAPAITSATNPVNAANAGSFTASGTAEAGSTVTVTVTDGASSVLATATTDGSGAWSTAGFDVSALADGSLDVTAVARDKASNASPTSAKLTVSKDTKAPALSAASPVGGSTVRPPASVALAFSEPLKTGSISLSRGGATVAGTSSVSGSTVTFTPAATLADGSYTATASVTDAAGNPAMATSGFTVDGTAPAISDYAATSPVRAGATATTVSGTRSEAAAVRIVATDAAGATVSLDVPSAAGTFKVQLDLGSLGEGAITVTSTPTDSVGNVGTAVSTTVTKDTVAPTVTKLAATPTNVNNPATTVTGTRSEAASVVVVATDKNQGTVSATVASGTGDFSVALDLGSLADGPITVTATPTDTVGNTGDAASTNTSKNSVNPEIGNLRATVANSASSPTSTTVTGDLTQPATVTITVSDGTRTATAQVSGTTSFSATVDVHTLAEGPLTVSASATSSANNTGTTVTTTTTKDTVAPSVGNGRAVGASGDQRSVTVSGTRSESSSVVITASQGSATPVSSTVSVGADAFSRTLRLGSDFKDGKVTITLTPTDEAGNVGNGTTVTYQLDTTGPAVSNLAANPATLNASTQTTRVTGMVSEAATVALVATDSAGSQVTGSVSSAGGSFAVALNLGGLRDGKITIAASTTDTAGNPGTAASVTVTKDTAAPTLADLKADPATLNRSTTTTTISGTRSETATVAVVAKDASGTTVPGTAESGTGVFAVKLDLSGLAEGDITVTATPTDSAGNAGAPSSTTVRKDTVSPTITMLSANPATLNAKSSSTTVSGTRSETAAVSLVATDKAGKTVTATVDSAKGSFTSSLDLGALADGAIKISATPTDTAGNTGTTVSTTISKDTVAPAITGFAADPEVVNRSTSTTTVSGTRSEAATVDLTATDSRGGTVTGFVASGTGAFTKSLDLASLADGVITITATPTDGAGNPGAAVSATVTKDTVAPVVSNLRADPATVNKARTTTTVTGSRSETAAVRVSASDGSATVSEVVPSGGSDFSVGLDLGMLADGSITITATPTDTAGNPGTSSPSSVTVSKDTGAPTISGLSASPTRLTAARTITTVSGTRSETSSVSVTARDGAGKTVVEQVASGTGDFSVDVDLRTLADGDITITAIPTDTAGNPGTSSPSSVSVSKDTGAPMVSGLSASDTAPYQQTTTVRGTRSEQSSVAVVVSDRAGKQVKANVPVGFGAFTVQIDLSSLGAGPVTVSATATDTAGNVGPTATTTAARATSLPATTIALDPVRPTIGVGQTLKISGRLARTDTAVPYGVVTIRATDAAGGVIEKTATPGSDGRFEIDFTPQRNTTFVASYAGDSHNQAATSNDLRTTVTPRLTGKAKTSQAGGKTTIKGTILPAEVGAKLTLVSRSKPLGSGKKLATTRVKQGGRYTFKVALPRGKSKLAVLVPQTATNSAGETRLTVRRR